MNRKLLRKVAKIHGVSVAEVKRELQTAIDEAYKDMGRIPSIDEVVDYATSEFKRKSKK